MIQVWNTTLLETHPLYHLHQTHQTPLQFKKKLKEMWTNVVFEWVKKWDHRVDWNYLGNSVKYTWKLQTQYVHSTFISTFSNGTKHQFIEPDNKLWDETGARPTVATYFAYRALSIGIKAVLGDPDLITFLTKHLVYLADKQEVHFTDQREVHFDDKQEVHFADQREVHG